MHLSLLVQTKGLQTTLPAFKYTINMPIIIQVSADDGRTVELTHGRFSVVLRKAHDDYQLHEVHGCDPTASLSCNSKESMVLLLLIAAQKWVREYTNINAITVHPGLLASNLADFMKCYFGRGYFQPSRVCFPHTYRVATIGTDVSSFNEVRDLNNTHLAKVDTFVLDEVSRYLSSSTMVLKPAKNLTPAEKVFSDASNGVLVFCSSWW